MFTQSLNPTTDDNLNQFPNNLVFPAPSKFNSEYPDYNSKCLNIIIPNSTFDIP